MSCHPPIRRSHEIDDTDSAGLILAGGEGKRWGGPKAWAKLPDGRTFLESCFHTLQVAGIRPIVATLPPEADEPPLDELVTVNLEESGLDMFASLVAGLSRLVEHRNWKTTVILPVDHPLVSASTITTLAIATVRATIPSFNGKHGHPVCLERSVAENIVNGTLTGPTLREVMRSVDAVDVPVADVGVISNCNSPEALAKALDVIHLRPTTQN